MAKEFFKKIALGVAISCASVAVLSTFSRLGSWLSPDEEEGCTHTNIIEVSGVAPTCTKSGLSDGLYCGTCKGVIKAQEVIDALGHVQVTVPGYPATCKDEGLTDGIVCGVCETEIKTQRPIPVLSNHDYVDGLCSVCGILDLTACEEVAVEKGELVGGNWYRLYNFSNFSTNASLVNSSFESSAIFYRSIDDGSDGFISYCGYTGHRVIGMQYVFGDDYVDLYFAPGTYTLLNYPDVSFEITAEMSITDILGSVYRLVLPGENN